MIRVEPTDDLALVRGVLTHPSVWPYVSDDGAPPIDEWQPLDCDAVTYLAVYDGDQVAGAFMLYPRGSALWELHSAILPEFRGKGTKEAGDLMLAWLWGNTRAERLETSVPAYNRPAAIAAKRAGFTECGKHPNAYRKDGRLHDITIFGVSR